MIAIPLLWVLAGIHLGENIEGGGVRSRNVFHQQKEEDAQNTLLEKANY